MWAVAIAPRAAAQGPSTEGSLLAAAPGARQLARLRRGWQPRRRFQTSFYGAVSVYSFAWRI